MGKIKPYNGNKFYNGNGLLEHKSTWNAVIGRRSNGKSFWWLQLFLIEYFEKGVQFAYVRRQDNEVKKQKVDEYFSDGNLQSWLKKCYGYEGIICDRGELWLWDYNEKDKIEKKEKVGNVFAVSVARTYKSLHFDKIGNILYEEFITDGAYLADEWKAFNSIISTILRLRSGRIVLIGNTVARNCPYFTEMGIEIMRLKQGTITDIDHIQSDGNKVSFSVEYCADIEQKNKVFFGKAEQSINAGYWETEEYPHLFFKLEEAEILYKFYYIEGQFCFRGNMLSYKDKLYLYFYPYDQEKLQYNSTDDIFFKDFTVKDNVYNAARKKRHDKIWPLFEKEKVLYSDNLCGTELTSCLTRFNPF